MAVKFQRVAVVYFAYGAKYKCPARKKRRLILQYKNDDGRHRSGEAVLYVVFFCFFHDFCHRNTISLLCVSKSIDNLKPEKNEHDLA